MISGNRTDRRWPSIDLLELKAKSSASSWNKLLSDALIREDIMLLQKLLYGIQAGMSDAAKNKHNTRDIVDLFIRLQRSIENTAKKIYRKRFPNPCDDPFLAGKFLDRREAKRKRDAEFERFIRGASF